jgi:hypothetical protein
LGSERFEEGSNASPGLCRDDLRAIFMPTVYNSIAERYRRAFLKYYVTDALAPLSFSIDPERYEAARHDGSVHGRMRVRAGKIGDLFRFQ